jgi:hypothetical protein
MDWKYSSMGMRSLSVGIASLPYGARALETMTSDTQSALKNPSTASWHDGSLVLDAAQAVHRLGGDSGVELMNLTAAQKSIGPILAPFVKVSLALFGATPNTTLSRMNESLVTIMKGVRSEWELQSKNAGRLTIFHPDDVVPVSWPCWRGALLFSYELSGSQGDIRAQHSLAKTRTLVFECSWK